jgi:hypothetical protein
MSHLRLYIFILSCAAILAACSGGARNEPEMIASFPSSSTSNPQPINPPPPAQYVYNAYLELEVSNLDRVSDRAIDLAYKYNGYLVNWQTWRSGDTSHVSLVLAVPAANFDTAYNALSQLGDVIGQHISGEWASSRPGDGWNVYSEITVQLNDPDSAWSPQIGGWSPLRTLSSAWDVFTTIFGFLADVIIWLVVVLGPFLVLAYILYRVIKRLRRSP